MSQDVSTDNSEATLFPLECTLTGVKTSSSQILIESGSVFDQTLLPSKIIEETEDFQEIETALFPNMNATDSFADLLSKLLKGFVTKQILIEHLRLELAKKRIKLETERIKFQAYQELIHNCQKELELIQSRKLALISDSKDDQTLVRLARPIESKKEKMAVLAK